ncbi:SDR family NAD(P)-dependent oxidoreductase [Streptomyces sp. NPDC047002]|uniref:SDR family NAD(P)-dependent oxidoreductase n=1 Tax=Streptomyces sp. NPDC047002 TaxID=3155475 RepID=UPI0034572638
MLVCVTGGTGFVGAHSTAALVRAGCRVRLLARDPDTVPRALAPLGVDPAAVDSVAGDVRDEAAVKSAVAGTDAVLHAASVYSFDSRRADEMRAVNVRGTEVVLGAAARAGAGRIVHVSSFASLLPSGGGLLDERSPVGRPRDVYMRTKAEAEEVALALRERGAPIVISLPPALLGPCDPRLGDQTTRLLDTLRGLMPLWPAGGFPVGDVRDTAALHTLALTGPPPGTSRLFGPGRYLTTRQYVAAVRRVTGRRLPSVVLPGRALLPVGRVTDVVQRILPWRLPPSYGAVYACVSRARIAPWAAGGGVPARPTDETFTDTVRWLHAAGHLTARQAGAASAARAPGRATVPGPGQ